MPPLSIIIWLPAACGLLGALLGTGWRRGHTSVSVPATSDPDSAPARTWSAPGLLALAGSLAALGLAVAYIVQYGPGAHGLKDVTDVVWISELGIHYKLGLSGLNVLLVGLTALLFFAAVLAANLRTWKRPKLFYFHFMLAESAVLGEHEVEVEELRALPRAQVGGEYGSEEQQRREPDEQHVQAAEAELVVDPQFRDPHDVGHVLQPVGAGPVLDDVGDGEPQRGERAGEGQEAGGAPRAGRRAIGI